MSDVAAVVDALEVNAGYCFIGAAQGFGERRRGRRHAEDASAAGKEFAGAESGAGVEDGDFGNLLRAGNAADFEAGLKAAGVAAGAGDDAGAGTRLPA